MKKTLLAAVAAVTMAATSLVANPIVPVQLEPIKHANATLLIVDNDGIEHRYSPAELEQFNTYSLTTTTPWRNEAARFEGVRLSDILAAHGLDNASGIAVTAENDYRTTIDQELLSSIEILVATRVDGRAHSRRTRGPIQFVLGAEAFENSSLTSESNFVWMAARIEAVD